MTTDKQDDANSQPGEVRSSAPLGLVPEAWMCEFVTACESTETQFVTEDPAATRWADVGDPSPYRVTPLYTEDQVRAAVAAERERWKAMMLRAIATCFDERAHYEVMSDKKHFAAEALWA